MNTLDRSGDVFVLTMQDGENRFNPASMGRIHEALDEVEAAGTPAALVVTGTGKFFSNGLDLDAVQAGDADLGTLASESQLLMARTLTMGVPTVAAINGHCFAAGAMWSLSFDYRVMRHDRGFWCLPEVDLGIPFTRGMNDLLTHLLPMETARKAMTTGHRFGGEEALLAAIVDETAEESDVLDRATARAADLAPKAGEALRTIKSVMFRQVAESLRSS